MNDRLQEIKRFVKDFLDARHSHQVPLSTSDIYWLIHRIEDLESANQELHEAIKGYASLAGEAQGALEAFSKYLGKQSPDQSE